MVLLFRPKHVPLILDGTKTQTRRVWKKARVKIGGIYWCSTKLFDKSARFARVRVLRMWEEPLCNISEEDARKEGYADSEAFLDTFCEINGLLGEKADPDKIVTAIEFKRV